MESKRMENSPLEEIEEFHWVYCNLIYGTQPRSQPLE